MKISNSFGARRSFADSTHVNTAKDAKTISPMVQPRSQRQRMTDGRTKTKRLPSVETLISAKLLPAGFVLLPSVEPVKNAYGAFMFNRKLDDKGTYKLYRAACNVYAVLHPESDGGDPVIAAEHREESRWAHKTADPARSNAKRR